MEATLTARLERAIGTLFAPEESRTVSAWLSTECSARRLSVSDPRLLERIQAAALKRSGGSISALEIATRLAQHDWRDLLMSAGFGSDPTAHDDWLEQPTR